MFVPKKKKAKLESHPKLANIKFKDVCVFILPFKIQKVRLEHMKKLARKKGFDVTDILSEKVTHIVSECVTKQEVINIMSKSYDVTVISSVCEMVSVQWFVDCMEVNDALPVNNSYRLSSITNLSKVEPSSKTQSCEDNYYKDSKYACQRSTPFHHPNKKLTDPLEILEKHAEFQADEHNNARALAFRKASAALKAYPSAINTVSQVEKLKDLGGQHCKQVIQEILEEGYCSEVDNILASQWYKTMLIFTGVFGCGPVTAKKWCDKGYRTLDDVKKHMYCSLTKEQKIGVDFYDDLNKPVNVLEAQVIRKIVHDEAVEILPGTTVTITGGFSRGKDVGHDVDLLISHPGEGKEDGILHKLLNKLKCLGHLLYTSTKENTYSESMYTTTDGRKGHMDHYARCFSVFKLPLSTCELGRDELTTCTKFSGSRTHDTSCFVARRVDLIIVPANQHAYALLGWTGSRMFIRSIRDYSRKEMNMILTSHGLYDKNTNTLLPASNEREIFQHLQLEYREPWERNC